MGVDRRVGQELAYVKRAAVGDKVSERSEPPISSYPYEIRHGVPCWPDWIWPSLDAWRHTPFAEDRGIYDDGDRDNSIDCGGGGAPLRDYSLPQLEENETCGTAEGT